MKTYLFIFSTISLLFLSCVQESITSSYNKFKDSDLDGVHDDRDECPHEPGSIFNMGCPYSESKLSLDLDEGKSTDSDLDGVPDYKDECPFIYGSPFNQGCPIGQNKTED